MPEDTLLSILNRTTEFFEFKGVPEARLNAQLILAHGLKMERVDLYLNFDRPLAEKELSSMRELVRRRSLREPLQHVLNEATFRHLDFVCDRRALIPRAETEVLVDLALAELKQKEKCRVLDLCTGSGAIVLSLAKEAPEHTYIASDLSAEALVQARENADKNELSGAVEWLQSDLFSVVKGNFDLILCNPPYIESKDIAELDPEVREFDPLLALDGGADGLDLIRKILGKAPAYLKRGGLLILEIGHNQQEAIFRLAEENTQWKLESIDKDLEGRARFPLLRLL